MPRLGNNDPDPNWAAWVGLAACILVMAIVLATRK